MNLGEIMAASDLSTVTKVTSDKKRNKKYEYASATN